MKVLIYSRWVHQACRVVFVTSGTRKEGGEEIERRGGEQGRRAGEESRGGEDRC